MNEWEKWQPLFRFLDRLNKSDFVGLVFSIVYLTGVVAMWYWVCFKDGAEIMSNRTVAWNKRLGISNEWYTPFLAKVGANILLLGSVIGLFLALLSYINRQ